MTIDEVYDAFNDRDTLGLEAAFSTLVDWPSGGVIEGLKDAEQYMDLLARLTSALDGDVRFMPAQTCKTIQDATGQVVFAFRTGVRIVADNRDIWRSNFAATPLALERETEQGSDEAPA